MCSHSPLTRRKFSVALAVGLSAALLRSAESESKNGPGRRFQAVVFDAFPIFDPRPVAVLAEQLFPGRGGELMAAWRTRQFEYTWLRTLSRRYVDFAHTTDDALVFAARTLRLELTDAHRQALVGAYSQLKAWPDVLPALTRLRDAGVRLGLLSNFTRAMLAANIRASVLEGFFEHVLSTDEAQAFKPDPRAYQMGIDAFKLPRDQIVFAAFAGWDAAGAKSFGYPTFWVNRANAPAEELGITADGEGGIAALVDFVLAGR